VIGSTPIVWAVTLAVLILIAAYGIGAPFLLLRTTLAMARRRRLRFRPHNDEVLATSRFTIPVSLIVPVEHVTSDLPSALMRLLQFHYPELELIVVVDAQPDALDTLKLAFDLNPCELFFRRSLSTGPIRTIYRSAREPRLLVVDKEALGEGDALNCGLNLARYRYVCAADADAVYDREALLEAMQAALEDPSLVVGAATTLTVTPIESATTALSGQAPAGPVAALRYLAAARTRLLTVGRRRLDLPPGGCPGFTIWRRDAAIAAGGFAAQSSAAHADLTLRMHRLYRGDRQRYRIIHVAEPVGVIDPEAARERIATSGRIGARVLWHHRGLLFNPRLGRLGLFDFPRYVFNVVIAPWLELAALVLLAAAVPVGMLTGGELLLVLFILALGSGVIANASLLLSGDRGRDARPATLFNLILVGPLEYFLTRPALLLGRRQ
jgi:cellulose synthase/poly-beta-1,6-N-acetylglucosamine synthase-like glycosyltransferase